MPVLRPISEAEFETWLATVIPGYAEDKVASGQWPAESALELSRKEYAELLPRGKDSENNYIFSIVGADGAAVGRLWFVAKDRANRRIAYIYDHSRPKQK